MRCIKLKGIKSKDYDPIMHYLKEELGYPEDKISEDDEISEEDNFIFKPQPGYPEFRDWLGQTEKMFNISAFNELESKMPKILQEELRPMYEFYEFFEECEDDCYPNDSANNQFGRSVIIPYEVFSTFIMNKLDRTKKGNSTFDATLTFIDELLQAQLIEFYEGELPKQPNR